MKWAAVVVAAGRGTRFGKPKQLMELAGLPMLAWSVRTFAGMQEIREIVLVTEAAWLDEAAGAATHAGSGKCAAVVPGGRTRQASVLVGLRALSETCDAVLVHDGARPLIAPRDVREGMALVSNGCGALIAAPVVDTIKVADPETQLVRSTLDRSMLWSAQTPQFAMRADLRRAHEEALNMNIEATDDAMLLERAGVRMHLVPASAENFKVTLPEDLARADHVLRDRLAMRKGNQ